MDYQGRAVDLSEDFTVAASNVITTLTFGKEVSSCPRTAQFVTLSTENGLQNLFFIYWGCDRPVSSLHYINAFIMCYFVDFFGRMY